MENINRSYLLLEVKEDQACPSQPPVSWCYNVLEQEGSVSFLIQEGRRKSVVPVCSVFDVNNHKYFFTSNDVQIQLVEHFPFVYSWIYSCLDFFLESVKNRLIFTAVPYMLSLYTVFAFFSFHCEVVPNAENVFFDQKDVFALNRLLYSVENSIASQETVVNTSDSQEVLPDRFSLLNPQPTLDTTFFQGSSVPNISIKPIAKNQKKHIKIKNRDAQTKHPNKAVADPDVQYFLNMHNASLQREKNENE